MEHWTFEQDFQLHNLVFDRMEHFSFIAASRDLTDPESKEFGFLVSLYEIVGPRIKQQLERQ